MAKVQYSVARRDTHNASGKAKWDASDILLDLGFNEMYEPSSHRGVRVLQQFWHLVTLGKGSQLAVQYPANISFFYRLLARRRINSFALIHDLESLRTQTGIANDMAMLSAFDGLISHNPSMTRELRRGGFDGPIAELGLFDYLGFKGEVSEDRDLSVVSYAGNLSKSGFIGHLHETKLSVNLFGGPIPDDTIISDNVRHLGSFPANDVPGKISGGWGLVWDGDSVSDCTGNTGNYLRYNNPHKASMYVIAERPLIVWKESAIAAYVEEKHIGIAVASLHEAAEEINSIESSEYHSLLRGVRAMKAEIASGMHLTSAVKTIEEQLEGL